MQTPNQKDFDLFYTIKTEDDLNKVKSNLIKII